MQKFSEWFGSEDQAQRAAKKLEKQGYKISVRYARRYDMSYDWLVECWWTEAKTA